MNRIHVASLALGLAFISTVQAAEFGNVPDPYTGNWFGTWKTDAGKEELYAIIVARKNDFEVSFRSSPNPRDKTIAVLHGTVEGNRLVLNASSGAVENGELGGSFSGQEAGTFSLEKVPFHPSETLGEQAPSGALVLFDGSDLQAWEDRKQPGNPIQWKITEDGALEVVSHRDGKRAKQDLKTKELFGDYRLHLEFNLVHKPQANGQGRSNSGIFHHGVYETQILDSFGLYGRDNECGGIYKMREPDSNAGYPGGLWQTYDVELKAPRFDAMGNKTADARITVRLNGVLIHDDVAVKKGGREPAEGPIILQDHGNPVRYRNIWVVKLDDA